VLRCVSDLSGFRVGTTLLRGVYRRLGDHLARLPVGWYDTGRVGEVSVMASRGVLQAMSVIAHLLAPFVSACATPLTIIVVMLAFDWRMGLAAPAGAPVVAVIQIWTGRSMAAADAERHERGHEAGGRFIEYLQAQPVLRAGGRTAERFRSLDDSLREVQRASRRTVLSGGERQRVSIARALLKDAPVVLLDEVTSALDPVNEAAVHEGIERLMAGRTVVMVAHRMRTVRRADRIVFLDGGRIVEEGGHDELLHRGGRYADFWNVSLAPATSE